MSVTTLLIGALPRPPEAKTSKAGKAYAAASVKVASGNEVEFWSALAFNDEAREALLACAEGEKVALQGTPKFDGSTNAEGELKIRKTLFVDAVLTARPKPRERKPKVDKAPRTAPAKDASRPAPSLWNDGGDLNDDIPF